MNFVRELHMAYAISRSFATYQIPSSVAVAVGFSLLADSAWRFKKQRKTGDSLEVGDLEWSKPFSLFVTTSKLRHFISILLILDKKKSYKNWKWGKNRKGNFLNQWQEKQNVLAKAMCQYIWNHSAIAFNMPRNRVERLILYTMLWMILTEEDHSLVLFMRWDLHLRGQGSKAAIRSYLLDAN